LFSSVILTVGKQTLKIFKIIFFVIVKENAKRTREFFISLMISYIAGTLLSFYLILTQWTKDSILKLSIKNGENVFNDLSSTLKEKSIFTQIIYNFAIGQEIYVLLAIDFLILAFCVSFALFIKIGLKDRK
jgi:hypothetical protein